MDNVTRMGVVSKLAEVAKEVGLLMSINSILLKTHTLATSADTSDTKKERTTLHSTTAAMALFMLTASRWEESNRRLLALLFLVRSADMFQGAWASRTAISTAFVLTAGELGRRWRGWTSPTYASLHPQFVAVMANLSGTQAQTRVDLANKAELVGKSWTLLDWRRATASSATFAVSLMTSAYTLQAVIQYVMCCFQNRTHNSNATDTESQVKWFQV